MRILEELQRNFRFLKTKMNGKDDEAAQDALSSRRSSTGRRAGGLLTRDGELSFGLTNHGSDSDDDDENDGKSVFYDVFAAADVDVPVPMVVEDEDLPDPVPEEEEAAAQAPVLPPQEKVNMFVVHRYGKGKINAPADRSTP